jgi:hypothetical protein
VKYQEPVIVEYFTVSVCEMKVFGVGVGAGSREQLAGAG